MFCNLDTVISGCGEESAKFCFLPAVVQVIRKRNVTSYLPYLVFRVECALSNPGVVTGQDDRLRDAVIVTEEAEFDGFATRIFLVDGDVQIGKLSQQVKLEDNRTSNCWDE